MLTPPNALEALLFTSGEPLEKKQIAKLLGIKEKELEIVTKTLSESLEERGVVLIETDTELELRTAPDASDLVKQFYENELSRDLGKGSMETLAVIAYQSGSTRGEIDWVRGVNSSASLRILLMRGLIRSEEDPRDKRRLRYSLTTEALAHLGVTSADKLPRAEEFGSATKALIEESATLTEEATETV